MNVAECSPADPEKLNDFHNWADFNDRQISQIMKCMYSRMSHMIVAVVFLFSVYHDHDPIIKIPDHAMQNLKVVFISTFYLYPPFTFWQKIH